MPKTLTVKDKTIGTKEQRLVRIGGSEFSTIMDINPYSKRIELILEKAGVIASTFEGNYATERGSRLEQEVIRKFEEDSGLTVKNQQKEFKKAKTPTCLELCCHVDGITSDKAVFEAKTTDYKSHVWDDGIPEYYKAQLEFNCYLSKKDRAYIAVAFCKGDQIIDFKWFMYLPVMAGSKIIEYCEKFTKEVEHYKTQPVVNDGQIIKSKFDDSIIEELNNLNEQISKIKAQAKVYEDQKKIIEDKLKKEIGTHNGVETDLFRITLGNRITQPSFDYKFGRSTLKIEYKKGEN